jgi:hypothetical protein
MVAATIMSLSFTPVFYVVMKRLGESRNTSQETGEKTSGLAPSNPGD